MVNFKEKLNVFLDAFEKELASMSDEDFIAYVSDIIEVDQNSVTVSAPEQPQADLHWQFQDQPSQQTYYTPTGCLPQKEATFF